MKKIAIFNNHIILTFVLLFSSVSISFAQVNSVMKQNNRSNDTIVKYGNPKDVPGAERIIYRAGKCIKGKTSKKLSDIPPLSREDMDSIREIREKRLNKKINKKPEMRTQSDTILSFKNMNQKSDSVQEGKFRNFSITAELLFNVNGEDSGNPPDSNGDVGETYYVHATNDNFSIYNKETGNLASGPHSYRSIFNHDDIEPTYDPIVIYDHFAHRWFVGMIGYDYNNDEYYLLTAITVNDDPTGEWQPYYWLHGALIPDYPKFGIMQDGYYVAICNYEQLVDPVDFLVFERTAMLEGLEPQVRTMHIVWGNGYQQFHIAPPAHNCGQMEQDNMPATYVRINDDAWGGSDELILYEYSIDWDWPLGDSFIEKQRLIVDAFTTQIGQNTGFVEQPQTTNKLDPIMECIMNYPQYRNFGDYESIVCCHTVIADEGQTGIRWYELRRYGGTGNWYIRQQNTYSPDHNNRFMGSIALNNDGQLGLAFSVSGTGTYPSIAFTGQSTSEYALKTGFMDLPEVILMEGNQSYINNSKWGDYISISNDPINNDIFWFTSQYVKNQSDMPIGTKIAAFRIEHDCDCGNGVCEPSCGETLENCEDCDDGNDPPPPPPGGVDYTNDPYWVNFSCDGEISDCIVSIDDFKINCSDDSEVVVCEHPSWDGVYPIRLTPRDDGCRFDLSVAEHEEAGNYGHGRWCDSDYGYPDYCESEGWLFWEKCLCEYWMYFIEFTECDNELNPIDIKFSDWLKVVRTTELPPPSLWVYISFFVPQVNIGINPIIHLEPGKYYRIKLASIVNGWQEYTKYVYTGVDDLILMNEIDGRHLATNNIILQDVTIPESNEVGLLASNNIWISENTMIFEGSGFTADIIPDLECNSAPKPYNLPGVKSLVAHNLISERSIINEVKNDNPQLFSLIPNPSEGIFLLDQQVNNRVLINSIKIINSNAEVVYEKENVSSYSLTIDLSDQNDGVYLLYVVTIDGIETYKLIKC